MRILVADDEAKIRSLYKTILSSEFPDSIIDMVENGIEAVNAFRKGDYDVLLFDLYMPVKNGSQTFLEIREICGKKNRKIPYVIFCSGFPVPEELEETIANDPSCCILQKPVSQEDLLVAVRNISTHLKI